MATKFRAKLGSRDWLNELLKAPAARDVCGRSRPTQRYVVKGVNGQLDYAEGGNCATAHSLLVTMANAGVVEHVKLEPFQLTVGEHGLKAVPDILFTMKDGRVFVVETKSARYLTPEKLDKCEAVERVINHANMTYLFWTDQWPLTPACCRVMRRMRRCGTSDVPKERVLAAIHAVQEQPRTLGQLRQLGVFTEEVLAAAWVGELHLDLFRDLSDSTLVTSNVSARRFEDRLNAKVSAHGWMDRLPKDFSSIFESERIK